jgi:hypothetical protein
MKLLTITVSDKPEKKMKAMFLSDAGRTRTIHFGQAGADDYTITKDKDQRDRYLARHKKENWNKPDSAAALSRWILWGDSTSIHKNIADYKKKFKL